MLLGRLSLLFMHNNSVLFWRSYFDLARAPTCESRNMHYQPIRFVSEWLPNENHFRMRSVGRRLFYSSAQGEQKNPESCLGRSLFILNLAAVLYNTVQYVNGCKLLHQACQCFTEPSFERPMNATFLVLKQEFWGAKRIRNPAWEDVYSKT
jgi:hypothetical protein